MTAAAVIVLAVLLGLAVVWGVLCGLAARNAFGRALAAEDALTAERGVVAVQREEIGALARRVVDAERDAEEYARGLDYEHALRRGDDVDAAREHMKDRAMWRRFEKEIGEPEVTS